MSLSNRRSSSSRLHTSRRTQTDTVRMTSTSRSSSVPDRQFIIILTNHPDMIRRTTNFRPQTTSQQVIPTSVPIQISSTHRQTVTNANNNNNNNNNTHQHQREQILNSLLRVDLSEAIRSYLSRTHRSFPIHYVFDISNVEASTPTQP